MNETERCLNMINAIDDNELIAESEVLSALIEYNNKLEMMTELYGSIDDVEKIFSEASIGTGAVPTTDGILGKIWYFVRRVILSIINKISDIMTAIKVKKYKYVEIPMSLPELKDEVNEIDSIFAGLLNVITENSKIDSDNFDAHNFSGDTVKLKQLTERAFNLKIFKVDNKRTRCGVESSAFMTIRDKLRFLNQRMNDLNKLTERSVQKFLKHDQTNKSYVEYCQNLQKVTAKMSEAATKLFASFKFSNISELSKESLEKEGYKNIRETKRSEQ